MNIGESLELVKQGQARPLAQASPERGALAPDIPTFKEQGFDLTGGVVRGLAVPAGTPEPVRARLEAALLATMDDPPGRRRRRGSTSPCAAWTAQLHAPRSTGAEALRRLWHERPWKD
jgi:tripartite-type tricarboxylate transporter receptor subunit TctC